MTLPQQPPRPPLHEPATGPLGPYGTASPRRPTEVKVAVVSQRERHEESRRRWDRRALALLAVVVLVASAPWLAWRLAPARATPVVVVTKTVPIERWTEHAGLFWWLDHDVRTRADGRAWDVKRDYLGWDPVARRGGTLDSAALAGARLLYLADSYGVYVNDSLEGPRALDHSRMIYGGIGTVEAQAIARFRARGGAVVAEFNTLESPTSGTPAAAILGDVLGARYERWVGRWYADLAAEDEIPRWMRERWKRRTGEEWRHRGAGLVFFREDDDRMVVLPAARFAGGRPVTIEVDRPDDPLVRGVRDGTPYWYWMAGVAPADSGLVLASFELHLDGEGERLMRESGFPLRFPAIVRHRRSPLAAYLAGDFAELAIAEPMRRTRGLDAARRLLARLGPADAGDMSDTFWNVSTPVWEAMLREAGL